MNWESVKHIYRHVFRGDKIEFLGNNNYRITSYSTYGQIGWRFKDWDSNGKARFYQEYNNGRIVWR